MVEDNTPALTRRLEAHAHGGKSKLYQYLRGQHRALCRAIAKLDPTWASIAAEITAAGVMGSNGKPASPKAVRIAWWRVCRDVEADKELRQATKVRRGRHPSRLPATSRPLTVEVHRPVEQPRYPPADRSKEPEVELNDAARETLASLQRQLDHSDRFLFPPKRKD